MKNVTILLLVGLLMSLPLMAIAQPFQGKMMGAMQGKMMDKLDLTDEQKAQVETFRLDHQKAMMALKDDLRSLRNDMKLLLTQDNPSSNDIKALAGKIGDATEKIATEKANHRVKVRNILTAEQKVKFDLMTLHHGGRGMHRGHCGFAPPTPPEPPAVPGGYEPIPQHRMQHMMLRQVE
jgi:Spy/CpxP family protein refolding chaperone